jgi:hypothetical protein
MQPRPLPEHLNTHPFAVSASGLPPKRLRARDLDRTVFGVRMALQPEMDLRARCAMFAVRLRDDAFFCHSTAALLYGAPLPWWLERMPKVHVGVGGPEPPPHAKGVTGHHLTLNEMDVRLHHGLRVTSPERTWFDLASVLPLEDLVAVGDFFVHRSRQLTTRFAIQRRLIDLYGKRGITNAREAVTYLRTGAESRPESKLRVIIVRGGLPEPEINHTLIDTETGGCLRPDFLFRAHKLILEYQGDYHRTRDQWRKDMTRRAKLEAAGWKVIELNADDLRDPLQLVARIRTALWARRP